MPQYEAYMESIIRTDDPLFGAQMSYIFDHSGKGIRPLLSLLSSKIHYGGKPIDERALLSAALVELIHSASLVHDDVVDEAQVRHGKPSVNRVWGRRSSIITGDYILARTFETGMESHEYDILTFISRSIKALCEGEVIQDEASQRLDMTREKYLDIIYRKTALLMGISFGSGAVAAEASTEEIERATALGEALGMAFQIKDDILDYSSSDQTGKPQCADLREHKITLPLLTLLEESTPEERALIKSLVAEADSHENSLVVLHSMVVRSGGLQKSEVVVGEYLDRARAIAAHYTASKYRDALSEMCDFMAERTK